MRIFIVNPVAGAGQSLKVGLILEKKFKNKNWQILYTKKRGEATQLAKKFKNKAEVIYSVGGDGTLNEIINGMVGGIAKLGIIPTGSGNDFYKAIKTDYNQIFESDLGLVNDHYFINVASVGIDAEVANNVEIMKKKKIAPSKIYERSLVYTFLTYKNKLIKVNKDHEKKFTLIAICNGNYYGNGYNIAPVASLTDQLFDIYLVDKINKLRVPFAIQKLKNGTHGQLSFVTFKKENSILLKSFTEMICNVDGEIIRANKLEFKIAHEKITIFNDYDLIKKINEWEKSN